MSEIDEVKAVRRALRALYLEVHESIADDIAKKVEAAFIALRHASPPAPVSLEKCVDALYSCDGTKHFPTIMVQILAKAVLDAAGVPYTEGDL